MLSTSHSRNTMLAERRKLTELRRMEILVALQQGKSPAEIIKGSSLLNKSQVYGLWQKLKDADGSVGTVKPVRECRQKFLLHFFSTVCGTHLAIKNGYFRPKNFGAHIGLGFTTL